MVGQDAVVVDAPDPATATRTQVGWGFWALWVLALAAAGALSYVVGTQAPLAVITLPPAAMLVFGLLAGGVQAFAARRTLPTARWWLLASALAGFVAAGVSVVATSLAETSDGLLAGWAYAWAAYGAVLGLMLLRNSPRRWVMLTTLAGWATAGIVSGAVGRALDVFVVTETMPTTAFFDLPSRTWSLAGLGVMGALCGAIGGVVTGAALVLLSRVPVLAPGPGEGRAKEIRLARIAGVICGLIAALLCTYLAPLVLTMLMEGSLDSLDMAIYPLSAIYGTPVCVPTIAIVSIPLGIGGGYVGLDIARATGRPGSRLLVWCGAAVGGVAGYLLGFLVAFAIGNL